MIILVGPSASGKTEIANSLIENFNFSKFVTTTTRKKRVGEKDDVDYHFIKEESFLENIKDNKFIEYVIYNHNYYGTSKEEISLNKVLIVEPSGLLNFIKLNDPTIVSFYIDAPINLRKERMLARHDEINVINERLANDDKYFAPSKKYVDFIIENDHNDLPIKAIATKIYNLYKEKIESKN